jgi:ABC-type lipoprotein release transport system permease subunit
LVQSTLEAINSRDPVTLIVVTTVLALVSLTATVLPARRAARVDPVVALRAE